MPDSDMTQKAIVCSMDEAALKCSIKDSDRFVFSRFFTPLLVALDGTDTPILTHYQKNWLLAYGMREPALAQLTSDPRFAKILGDNKVIVKPWIRGANDNGGDSVATSPTLDRDATTLRSGTDLLARDVAEITDLVRAASEGRGAESGALMAVIGSRLSGLSGTVRSLGGLSESVASSARAVVASREEAAAAAEALTVTTTSPDQALDAYLEMLRSEIGYLFMDRTRIRPKGFAIGEHLYSLSLAPGEEVVLEQRTFSKRQLTLEEQTEQEKEFNIEFSSTLSTELQEGFERQKNLSTTTGFTAGGSVGGNIEGVDVNASASYSNNVTEANNESRSRSVKTSSTASSKTASKYRTLHKTSFKLSTEQGFESTTKRVFRNPNRFTPIELHYFKILQVLELTQERYGVRLGWAPRVKGPGFSIQERIRKGREEILKKADQIEVPAPPTPPAKPNKPAKWVGSGPVTANKFSLTCGMSSDYDVAVDAPAGAYVWDGDSESVKNSVTVSPNTTAKRKADDWGWHIAIDPWREGANVKLRVHIGAGESPRFGSCGEFDIQAGANFIPDPSVEDPQYQAQYQAYLAALKEWQDKVNELKQAARAAAEREADDWEAATWANFNPVVELMSGIVQQYFPPASRDQAWEVEFWRNLFDWDAATYILYPSWWADTPIRDNTKSPTDFVNASWARLFLPIRLGFERAALRWIFDRSLSPISQLAEATFKKIEDDLKTYRKQYFGDEQETNLVAGATCDNYEEQWLCLGRWEECMPTDGTHLEVVQSMTSAADAYSVEENNWANKQRTAAIDSQTEDVEIKKKALSSMTGAPQVDVQVTTGTGAANP